MSLDYDLRNILGFEELDPGMTECLVFMTMFIGINHLTEATLPEFVKRAKVWERAYGPIRANKTLLTEDEIKRFVGLKTNAAPLSREQFKRNVWKYLWSL